jgi:deoxyribose-phosphate aldolase
MPDADAVLARRMLACLDLTDLSDRSGETDIHRLCRAAAGPPVPAAAICIWPHHVGLARQLLAHSPVKVATVANFPAGTGALTRICAEIGGMLRDGAQEIDLVMPWRAFLDGDEEEARSLIEEASALTAGDVLLKVILETGALPNQAAVAAAARLAIDAGAGFLKTSTGRTEVSATPEAARTLFEAVRDADRPVGVKVSGGIRSFEDARGYLALADEVMGPGWATASTFRIGASSLRDALVAVIEAGEAA